MVLGMLVLALSLAGDVLTVDDDGQADFTTIRGALNAAAAGDVLLVQAGLYEDFKIKTPVSILGPSQGGKPRILGVVQVVGVPVSLAGLEFNKLRIDDVPDRVVLDDCSIGLWNESSPFGGAVVDHCDEVLVSRCVILGEGGTGQNGSIGLEAIASRVAIVDCMIRGGAGFDWSFEFGTGGNGGDGVAGKTGSLLTIDGSLIEGGRAGFGKLFGGPACGIAGDGLSLTASTAVVRGTSSDFIHAGDDLPPDGTPGKDIVLITSSELVIGSVDFDPSNVIVAPGSTLHGPSQAEPFLEVLGEDAPGSDRIITLTGPAGQPAILALGLEQDLVIVPSLELPLWLRAQQVLLTLWVVTQGTAAPVTVSLQMPPSFVGIEGITLYAQAVFTDLESVLEANKDVVTNPAVIVVRF